jgi:ubiquinone/menaquinone biosynthesis C-methylase UbiE
VRERHSSVTTTEEKGRQFWERYAPRYDRDMRRCDRFLFTGGREWACGLAAGDVLEVAVGTGLNLSCYPSGLHLTGIDASPAMLAIARRRATDLGMQVDLAEGDAQALPFPDASYDTVVCTLSLCCIPDDKAAISEMHRVLRPGGRLILLDHVASGNPAVRAGQWLLERLTLRTIGEHQTRHPLALLPETGFVVEHSERRKAGIVERVIAVKPDPSHRNPATGTGA